MRSLDLSNGGCNSKKTRMNWMGGRQCKQRIVKANIQIMNIKIECDGIQRKNKCCWTINSFKIFISINTHTHTLWFTHHECASACKRLTFAEKALVTCEQKKGLWFSSRCKLAESDAIIKMQHQQQLPDFHTYSFPVNSALNLITTDDKARLVMGFNLQQRGEKKTTTTQPECMHK